jgi:hypothetical protein
LNFPQDQLQKESLAWGKTPEGREIGKAEPLFPRLEKVPPIKRDKC